jgi:hypothetical protein
VGNRPAQPQVAIERRRRRSDATFWADGTVTDHAYWGQWQARMWKRAGWKRALARLVVAAVVAGLWFHRAFTERATAVACGLAAGYGLIRLVLWWENWGHYRQVVRPLHYKLAGFLDAPARPRDWLDIPKDYATNPDAVSHIYPPKDLLGGDRDKEDITLAVQTALPGLQDPDIDWSRLGSHKPRIPIRPSNPPPDRVTWEQIAPHVAEAGPDELVVGIGRRDKPVKASLALDSPHFMINMGTGAGKSTLGGFWLVQELRRGGMGMILDAKHFSHPWAFKDIDAEFGLLPNVRYNRWIPDLHEAMMWLGRELSRRVEKTAHIIN